MIFGDKSIPSEQQQTIWNEDNTKLDMVSPLKAKSNKQKRLNMKTVVTLVNLSKGKTLSPCTMLMSYLAESHRICLTEGLAAWTLVFDCKS